MAGWDRPVYPVARPSPGGERRGGPPHARAAAGAAAIRRGLGSTRLDGRLQRISTPAGDWILDVAHNPAGVDALLAGLEDSGQGEPVVFLVSILRDKPWLDILEALGGAARALVLTTAPSAPGSRRWELERVTEAVNGRWPAVTVRAEADFDRAMETARELAEGGPVVVTGSAHTVGDALVRLGG